MAASITYFLRDEYLLTPLPTHHFSLIQLAQPFLDPSSCTSRLPSESRLFPHVHTSLEFIPDQSDRQTASAVLEAYRISYRIYMNHHPLNAGGSDRRDTIALEQLRRLVTPIPPDIRGGRSLVWVYFIAAAESSNDDVGGREAQADEPGNRAFFSDRLRAIYAATGTQNIPLGLAVLDQLSHTRNVTGWPDALTRIASPFVM